VQLPIVVGTETAQSVWRLFCGLHVRGFGIRSSIASNPSPGLNQMNIQWVPEVVSPWVKLQGREADHSPSSVDVKDGSAVPPLSHTPSWRDKVKLPLCLTN
jgi:hypothetical protein